MKKSGYNLISIFAAASLFGQFATGLTAPAALAADDLVDPIQETTVVEYGTGWYLRGHVSATVTQNLFIAETSVPIPGTTTQFVQNESSHNVFTFGAAVGYRFDQNYRFDIGAETLGHSDVRSHSLITALRPPCSNAFRRILDPGGSGATVIAGGQSIRNCLDQDESSYNLSALMGNVYYDLDNSFMGMKPFLGLGLGVVRNAFTSAIDSTICVPTDREQCNSTDGETSTFGERYVQEGTRNNGTSYHLAGSITAGVSYALGDNLYFDTSYNFMSMMEDPLWGGSNSISAAKVPTSFHSVKFGLRYEIW